MKILPVTLFKLLVAAYRKPPDSEISEAGDGGNDFEANSITFQNNRWRWMIDCRLLQRVNSAS
jgi:hypothetical protein